MLHIWVLGPLGIELPVFCGWTYLHVVICAPDPERYSTTSFQFLISLSRYDQFGLWGGSHYLINFNRLPAPPNYPVRDPKYHLIETIRPLIEVHWGSRKLIAEEAFSWLKLLIFAVMSQASEIPMRTIPSSPKEPRLWASNPQCTSIKGLMVSIGWYLRYLER